MTPKYRVDDEVIIVCPPGMVDYTGVVGLEALVAEVVDVSDVPGWRLPWGYRLDFHPPGRAIEECALRLKHRPADESYTQMLERLRAPSKRGEIA